MRSVRTGSPTRWVASTMNEGQPRYSPDGRFVAFKSDRSGAWEVWVADADGGSPRQLTHLGAYIVGFPRWSPDGKRIVFHGRVPDIAQIYVVDVDGYQFRNRFYGSILVIGWEACLRPRSIFGGPSVSAPGG